MTTPAVNLFSYNLPARVSAPKARDDMQALIGNNAIGALNEGAKHGHLFRDLGWDSTLDPGTPDPAAVLTIGWNPRRFEQTGSLLLRAYPDTKVGKWGAGPTTLRAGYEHGVRLADKRNAGREFWVINVHLAPSVTQNPKNLTKAEREVWEKRRALYRIEVDEIRLSAPRREPVVVVGDFNAERIDPLVSPLRRSGFTVIDAGAPDFGKRSITLCAFRGCHVEGRGVREGASDHGAAQFRGKMPDAA